MDTSILTEALRSLIPDALNWKLALYGIHKGRDGLELEWYLCGMKGIAVQADRLREFLLKKPVVEKSVAAYSPFLSDKENIGTLERSDELIHDQISDILLNIRNGQTSPPEDFVSGVLPKIAGFAFYGERTDEEGNATEQVLLMKRGNPFLTGGTTQLFMGAGSDVVPCDRPVLKLTLAVDFLLIGGVCYFLSSAIEKDFALENRHFAIAQKRMDIIANAEIVSDYDTLERCVMKAKNAKKFLDFDKGILEHIQQLPIVDREEFLSAYGVTIDHEGHMDTSDPDQCDLIIDLLCCRSFLDPLGRLSVGDNITPRE